MAGLTKEQTTAVVGSLAGTIDALASAVKNLGNMGHGAIALAAASRMETELERCLRASFRELDREMSHRLFGTYGPLSTFAALIDMAFACSIVDREVYDELRRIKTIRNKFAHARTTLFFDAEPIAQLVDKLRAAITPNAVRIQRYMDSIIFINDALEVYLVSKGVTEDISPKNAPKLSG
jgi:DNA-binding MltR family transcriptional regulator